MKDEKEEIKPAPLKNYICLNCKNILYNQTLFPYACPECERKTFHEYPHGRSLGESSEEQKRVPKLVKWAKDGYPPIDLNGQYRHVVELIWHYIDMEKKNASPTSEPPEEQIRKKVAKEHGWLSWAEVPAELKAKWEHEVQEDRAEEQEELWKLAVSFIMDSHDAGLNYLISNLKDSFTIHRKRD